MASENTLTVAGSAPPVAPARAPITTHQTKHAALALVVPPEQAEQPCQREAHTTLGLQPALTDPQAAAILGCCPRTVFSLRKSGQLPFFTVGNRPRVRREDLAEFISRRLAVTAVIASTTKGATDADR